MINFFKKQNNKKGFSLVETLVALFVFSVAITATMAVMSQGVSSITNSKNKITASFLAQEGIEFMRNVRDTYYLSEEEKNIAWQNFRNVINNLCNSGGCYVLVDEWSFFIGGGTIKDGFSTEYLVAPCSDNYCNIVYKKDVGLYSSPVSGSSGDPTPFSRKIYFEALDADNTLKITSEVSYVQGGKTNKVSFTDYLTNWAE